MEADRRDFIKAASVLAATGAVGRSVPATRGEIESPSCSDPVTALNR